MVSGEESNKVSIKIVNEKIWKEFCALSTEMVLTKSGRKLFPRLQYKITGLDPKKRYLFELHFQLVDNKKYKFKEGGWLPTECFEPNVTPQKVIHPDGWQNGEVWMQCGVKFDRVKITNNPEDSRGNVILQSMRKYQPVITIYTSETIMESVNGFFVPQERFIKVFEYSNRLQEFIAVTAYQNNRITALKITNNPYAKGFRDGENKRKRSFSSTGSTPSPELRHYIVDNGSPPRKLRYRNVVDFPITPSSSVDQQQFYSMQSYSSNQFPTPPFIYQTPPAQQQLLQQQQQQQQQQQHHHQQNLQLQQQHQNIQLQQQQQNIQLQQQQNQQQQQPQQTCYYSTGYTPWTTANVWNPNTFTSPPYTPPSDPYFAFFPQPSS